MGSLISDPHGFEELKRKLQDLDGDEEYEGGDEAEQEGNGGDDDNILMGDVEVPEVPEEAEADAAGEIEPEIEEDESSSSSTSSSDEADMGNG